MQLSDQDIHLLESFWKGQLPKAAQADLQERLAKEPDFLAAANEWKDVFDQGFKPTKEELLNRESLRSQFKVWDESIQETKDPKPLKVGHKQKILLLVAASITIIVVSGLLLLMFKTQTKSQQYFTHLDRDNPTLTDGRSKGEIAYDEHHYDQAWQQLEQEINHSNDSLNLLYAGVSAIAAGQEIEAIRLLSTILNSEEWSYYHKEARWYLGLAYWDAGELEAARHVFEQIENDESLYSAKATLILQQIGN